MSFTKEQDQYLKDHYYEGFRVSPALLAMNLHKKLMEVINRMSELGIRKKRNSEKW